MGLSPACQVVPVDHRITPAYEALAYLHQRLRPQPHSRRRAVAARPRARYQIACKPTGPQFEECSLGTGEKKKDSKSAGPALPEQ
jgi:hypothetical protein